MSTDKELLRTHPEIGHKYDYGRATFAFSFTVITE